MTVDEFVAEKKFFGQHAIELPYRLPLKADKSIVEEIEENGQKITFQEYVRRTKEKTDAKMREKKFKLLFWGSRVILAFFAFLFFWSFPASLIEDLITVIQAQSREEKVNLTVAFGMIPSELRFGFYVILLILYLSLPFGFFLFGDYWIKEFVWEVASCPQPPNKHLLGLARILDYLEKEQTKINADSDLNGKKFNPTVYSDLYVPFKDDSFVLEKVDPDWELQSVLFGFLSEWTVFSFLGVLIASMGVILVFSYFLFTLHFLFSVSETALNLESISNFILVAISWFSDAPELLCLSGGLAYYLNKQIKDGIAYASIRSYLISQQTQQVLDLSSEETLFFSREKESRKETDRKLDLLSARMTLEHLKELPGFPLWNRFNLLIKSVGILSVLSILYSFLVL